MRGPWVHWRLLAARYGVVVLLLSGLRLLFFLIYRGSLPPLPAGQAWQVALQGLRFDVATVVLWNAPLILLYILPLRWRDSKTCQRLLFTGHMLVNGLLLLICSIDLAFFGFNNKRVSRDLLGQLGAGVRNLPSFLMDYGWVAAVFLFLMWALWKGWRRLPLGEHAQLRWWKEGAASLIAVALFVLLGRGGWQYQGLSPAHAADHVEVAFAPIVTNSAFTFGYSQIGRAHV